MINSGNCAITVSSSALAVGTAWASLTAATKPYQILGVYGGASDIACNVDLIFGGSGGVAGSNKLRFHSSSGHVVSEWFGNLGPTTDGSVSVKTQNGAAKKCYADLIYRVVL